MIRRLPNSGDEMVMGEALRRFKPSLFTHLLARMSPGVRFAPSNSLSSETAVILRDVIFVDVSFYQKIIDFEKMKTAGALGVIIRAGQNNWIDPFWGDNWRKAKAAGLPRGSYWFYDSRRDPKEQARLWASLIAGDAGEMEHAADFEERYGGQFAGWRHWYNFLVEFQRLTGLPDDRIAIYTGYYYWLEYGPSPITEAASLAWFGRFPLWLAWYTDDPNAVRVPKPWINLRHWQKGTPTVGEQFGVQTAEIDMNYANMRRDEFLSKYAGEVIEPPPGGGDMEQWEIIWQDGARLRTGPAITYAAAPLSDNILDFKQVVNVKSYRVNTPNVDEWAQHENGYWFATIYNGVPRAKNVTPNPPAVNVADMPFTIVLGGGASPYVETVVSGVVKAK